MSSKSPSSGSSRANDREARLKAALKANLSRRKQQARARGTGKAAVQDASDPKATTENNKG